MKHFIGIVAILIVLFACSADYNTFGTSDYNNLISIKFSEQDLKASIYPEEHLVKISLVEPSNSQKIWDYITLESFELSHFASIHLLKSKIREFPKDSLSLDSLARNIIYEETPLKKGSKVKLSSNKILYVAVVSESEEVSIWQIVFTIPQVELKSSSSEKIEKKDDFQKDNINSSSSYEKNTNIEFSSNVLLNSNNDFSISFKNEIQNKVKDDTIFVTFACGTILSDIEIDTVIIHRMASVDKNAFEVSDWSENQKFIVTAENGAKKTWIVITQVILNSEKDFRIDFNNRLLIDKGNDTIFVKLKNGTSIDNAKIASFSISDGASINPIPDKVEKWNEYQTFKVIAEDHSEKTWVVSLSIAKTEEIASSEKELIDIFANGEIEKPTIDKQKKTIILHLASEDALSKVLISLKVSEKASHNLMEDFVDLRTSKKLVITAQDVSTVEWMISADFPRSSEADIVSFETEDFISDVSIDKQNRVINLGVPYGVDLSEVYFLATYSKGALKKSPKDNFINLETFSAEIEIIAANGTSAFWKINAQQKVPLPQIKSISIGKAKVRGIIDEENESIFFDMDYTKDLNLRSLEVCSVILSDGSTTSDIVQGESYDFAMDKIVKITNISGISKTYKLKAGYQYINSNFNAWKLDEYKNYNDIEGWDNGNNDYAKELTTSEESRQVVKMESQNASIKFASGNMMIAKFNPTSVPPVEMASYKDGNELIDFGKPFYGRPEFVEFDVKYTSVDNDSCDLYVLLESRLASDGSIRTKDEGSNVGRSSSDENILVASAWYRASTDSDESDPDVVFIKPAKRDGYKTIRLSLKYGEPKENSPIYDSSTFSEEKKNGKGIDNHLKKTSSPENYPVTHIRVVMASSALGNLYKGSVGSKLYVDEFRLIY